MNNNKDKPTTANYIPPLASGNHIKSEKHNDWWDEICKAHGAKNYWSKKKPKKKKD